MHKFSWRTMLIFVTSLLLAVMLIGLGTAYVSKLKQQRRELSNTNTSLLTRHPDAATEKGVAIAGLLTHLGREDQAKRGDPRFAEFTLGR